MTKTFSNTKDTSTSKLNEVISKLSLCEISMTEAIEIWHQSIKTDIKFMIN